MLNKAFVKKKKRKGTKGECPELFIAFHSTFKFVVKFTPAPLISKIQKLVMVKQSLQFLTEVH